MLVRAGGLTLTAPDVAPMAAHEPIEVLRMHALAGVDAPDGELHLARVENLAFGRRRAGQLRRQGRRARLSAYGQLLTGWDERGLVPRSTRGAG